MDSSHGCSVGSSRTATTALYELTRPLLFRIALRVTSNHADAEDAVHDVFLAILAGPNHPDHPAAYLSVAVRNRAISSLRGRRNEVQLMESAASTAAAPDLAPTPAPNLVSYAKAAGGDPRLLIIWHRLAAGQSYREIGNDLGMTVSAVKNLIYRSRQRLHQLGIVRGVTWS